jgi:hypothetical protein
MYRGILTDILRKIGNLLGHFFLPARTKYSDVWFTKVKTARSNQGKWKRDYFASNSFDLNPFSCFHPRKSGLGPRSLKYETVFASPSGKKLEDEE